jgi:glycosyltransferase involved in cell wall biosynthesis
MESLACGTPVVASNVGGIPDIVPEFCGILVPPKEMVALKNALELALSINWDSRKIRQWAKKELSSVKQCEKIIKIYQKAIWR